MPRNTYFLRATLAALIVASPGIAFAQGKAGVDYRQEALRIAGPDLEAYAKRECNPYSGNLEPLEQPTRIFDDLVFFGNGPWHTWGLLTSEGIILFGAMGNDELAQTQVLDGMAKLGLDPKQVKYIVLGHGHADQYGGAPYLKEKTGAHVVLSDADWSLLTSLPRSADVGFQSRKPIRDITVKDGEELKLGNSTVRLYVVPGHSLGTMAIVFDVHDKGKRHTAVIWGAGHIHKDDPLDELYLDSIKRFREITKNAGVDMFLDTAMMVGASDKPKGISALVVGKEGYQRSLDVLEACVRAIKADPVPKE